MPNTMRGHRTKSSAPAYPGAMFDSDGFCIAHSDVRLCRFTVDGSTKIVRKICFKCGPTITHNHVQRTKMQAYRKKSSLPQHRETPNEVQSSIEGGRISGDRRTTKKAELSDSLDPPAGYRAQRRNSQYPPAKTASRSRHRSNSPTRKEIRGTRGRTLSPLRKSLPNESTVRPLSSDEVMKKKITKEKIKELYQLMPPIYQPGNKMAESSGKTSQPSGARGSQHRKSVRQPVKQKMPFDSKGYCRAHPEVHLAEKNPQGEWNVVSGVCPQCCVSAVLAYKEDQPPSKMNQAKEIKTKKSSTKEYEHIIGKVVTTADESHHTQPTTPSSSYPSSPESPKPAFSTDYFTSANRNILGLALDIYQGERIVAELNQSCLSEATIKHKNSGSARRSNKGWDLPLSKEPPGRRL